MPNEVVQMRVASGKVATAAWVTVNAVLALTLWLQFTAVPKARVDAAMASASPPLQLPAVLPQVASLGTYQELIERPLFWAERRAQQESVQAAADGTPAPAPFTLLGVVKAAQSQAVLGKAGSKEVSRVYLGDVVEGWIVEAITSNSVTLVANGVRREILFGSRTSGK